MSPNNLQPKLQANKDQENHQNSSGNNTKKTATSSRPQEQSLKCPRCDSPNTKFCYYNNYSLTQPRHFCKTCRRYWTKGGALRNVPIGGGCRKNKKMKSNSRLSCDSKDSSGSSEIGGFKIFHGLSPAMDFNLGGLSTFPRLNQPPPVTGLYNQFASFGDLQANSSASGFSLDPSAGSSSPSLLGFNNYPLSSVSTTGFNGAIQEMGSGGPMNVHTNLASSIESLSSINQDLHWKLQQQRLAVLFGEGENNNNNNKDYQKDSSVSSVPIEIQPQKPQPILFQNLEISKPEACGVNAGSNHNSRKEGASGDIATEWFFGNSYGQVTATASTNSNGNNGNDNTSNWNGVQTWGDLHQFNALP